MEKNEFLRGKPRDAGSEQLLSLVFKAVTLVIIFSGVWAATQKFCASVNYDPGWVGKPFYSLMIGKTAVPLYKPFMILYWMLAYFRKTEIHPLLYAAVRVAGYTSAAAIAFYFLLEFVLIRNGKQKIFGTARWAREKELEKAGLLGLKGGVILGQLADARLSCAYDAAKDSVVMRLKKPSRRKIIQSGIYNTILSAPTRSGKGVSSVVPTLLSYPGSVIVLDFKGENFNMTSGFRARFGRVYRWEPTGYSGHRFNPLMEIREGDNAFSDANLIADILTTPASGLILTHRIMRGTPGKPARYITSSVLSIPSSPRVARH
jgi:type IV secretion system protein VirD4